MKDLHVHAAPSYYECETGVLERLEAYLQVHRIKKVFIIHGIRAWQATKEFFPDLKQVEAQFVAYDQPCSDAGIARLARLATAYGADAVLGIGGGTIMDTAKAVAHELNTQALLIPTLAATCAPWSSLSVIYDDEGRFVRFTIFPSSPLLVLVEPRIIAKAPVSYLRAGIADTLAKWYEARALTRGIDDLRVPVQLALQAALLCKETLLKDGVAALHAVAKGQYTAPVLHVIEANILAGGLVGGLGDHYGRIAAAHSIHNALTQFTATHHLLHGEKVAYGILVQLALEEEWQELKELIPFYQELQLPFSLAQVGLDITDSGVLQRIATQALAPGESIHFMREGITIDQVIEAIKKVEQQVEQMKH